MNNTKEKLSNCLTQSNSDKRDAVYYGCAEGIVCELLSANASINDLSIPAREIGYVFNEIAIMDVDSLNHAITNTIKLKASTREVMTVTDVYTINKFVDMFNINKFHSVKTIANIDSHIDLFKEAMMLTRRYIVSSELID